MHASVSVSDVLMILLGTMLFKSPAEQFQNFLDKDQGNPGPNVGARKLVCWC